MNARAVALCLMLAGCATFPDEPPPPRAHGGCQVYRYVETSLPIFLEVCASSSSDN